MTAVPGRALTAEFDVVGVSVGGALVSGALSVVAPSLVGLTGSLAVLALAGWLVLVRQAPGSPRRKWTGSSGWALASVALGAALFLGGVGLLLNFRGLVLGLSLVPLWGVARRLPWGGL
ncbi:MAG: hypothetical protein WB789_02255 [Thermoplasmata archaeon]